VTQNAVRPATSFGLNVTLRELCVTIW